MKTKIDKLIETYKQTFDSDPEWSGPALDYFKEQKREIENELEILELLKKITKVALNKLNTLLNNIGGYFDLSIIEKDLEVLEILKNVVVASPLTIRAIEVSSNYDDYKNKCEMMRCITVTKTIYNKIKEWLENE